MKRAHKFFLSSVCSVLVLVAPFMAQSMASHLFWGEVEIPDSLKN